MKFYDDDVAIVAYSGVFPDCEDETELFSQLLAGKCFIRDLTSDESENPLQIRYHYSADKKNPDTCNSKFGSKIAVAKVLEWAKKNGLNTETSTTVEIVIHELFRRLQEKQPRLFMGRNSECILGISTGETDPYRIGQRKLFEELKGKIDFTPSEVERIEGFLKTFENYPSRTEWLRKDIFSTLMTHSVRERFGLNGATAFVDAACASSLAAIMLAARRVREGDRELVITGGVDVSAVLVTLFAFSKLQVLSDGVMNPFDRTADGMNQGEAGALFALMRLKKAQDDGFPILGVIRNCDGSSDGALGGMVEPTEYGQNLAYDRAYQEVPLYPLSYLECHGTGTKLGDKTELSSTGKFFHPLPPIGSVKANVGHTIAAAGAVSLVKALKIIERRVIPRMPNFRKMERRWPHTINKENLSLPVDQTIRVGISSFGFGGANFHMVVDEYRSEPSVKSERKVNKDFRFILNGMAEIDLNFIDELFAASRFKIPPVAKPYADPAVLGAILAVDKLLQGMNVRLGAKQKERVGVISNSNSYLERMHDCFERIGHLEIYRRLDDGIKTEAAIRAEMPNDLTVTEDTFMWALNNLIAGRVTKDFDLKGPNFNLASEKASLGVTFSMVRTLLKAHSGGYILLAFDEDMGPGNYKIQRQAVRAFFVSDLEFALSAELPILKEITAIQERRPEVPYVNAYL